MSSLQTRLTLLVVGVLIVSLWTLAILVDFSQRDKLTSLLAGQQYATVRYMAEDIDSKIRLRLGALSKVAERFPIQSVDNSEALTAFLEDRRAVYNLFDLGLIIVKPDLSGAFGDYPALAGRRTTPYRLSPFKDVAETGLPMVGPPRIGRFSSKAVVVMAVPVKSADGRLLAIVAGVTTVDSPNFLDLITRPRETQGDFLVIAPQQGLVIAGTQPRFVLKALPTPGQDVMHDRYMTGYEGSGVAVNSEGVEELVSARRVPLADWIVVSRLATKEALAPVRELRALVFGGSVALSILVGAMAALFLRRALHPLVRAAATFDDISLGKSPLHALPVTGHDEVARLVESFNRLQERLSEETEALRQCSEAIAVLDVAFDFQYVNPAFERLFGYRLAEVKGHHVSLLMPTEDTLAGDCPDDNSLIGEQFEGERIRRTKDGRNIPLLMKIGPVRDVAGRTTGYVGAMTDLTVMKATERALKESEARYRQFVEDSPLGVLIVQDGVIKFINPALESLVGYSEAETLGHSFLPFVAEEDREKAAEQHRRRMSGETVPDGFECRVITRGGELRHWRLATRTIDWNGPALHAVVTDVTELKRVEEKLERSAHFDALTGVPNRVLLADRLRQALVQTSRSGRLMAICYLDLDGFKPINDTWGHEAGDRLLIEMAERLKGCLRAGDTVARLGGDEFVLLLLDLERIDECEGALQRVLESIAQPVAIADQFVSVSASVGVSVYPFDSDDPDTLLRHADQAMYLAKETGRNRYCLCEVKRQSGSGATPSIGHAIAE
jgi:diguanylate cyclase (GGDEF)-like protein/PAS domain S-box-containing protein